MITLSKADFYSNKTSRTKWYIVPLVVTVLLNVFGPFITLMMFQLNFDKHIEECQQVLLHAKSCQASCLLEEMMPEQQEAILERTMGFVYFFPALFFQDDHSIQTVLLSAVSILNRFSHYLMLYSPPDLEMYLPPPKLG